jgi:hypothetical protein
VSGKKKAKGGKKGKRCKLGRVKSGPRKGRCRKQKVGYHKKWRKGSSRSGASYMAGL